VEWVTGAAILAQVGNVAPSVGDADWADACASAVSAGLDMRLFGTVVDPLALPAELTWAALMAGVEAYKRREATFGLTGYVDLQGAAIRVARDYLESIGPIIARYATVGIA
jgi:hypothetical protein